MPSVAKLRRTWFALVREAGIQAEDRHAVQETVTGKPSTTDWAEDDWRKAIAQIQRDLGQHNDRQAHVREDKQGGVAVEPGATGASGAWATDAQARYLQDLVDRTDWRVGPLAYLSHNVLRGQGKALRRARLKAALIDHGLTAALWRTLTRKEADQAIHAFRKAARTYPRESAPSIASRDGGPEEESAHV